MEKEKIFIDDFIKKIDDFSSKEAKAKYLESIIIKDKYVDYLIKVNYAKNILNTSCFDQHGNIKMDSCKKYSLYIFTILSLYTYIDIPADKHVTSFDKLEKRNLINLILKLISEQELSSFNTILKMCENDMITNNYEIHGFINRKIEDLYHLVVKELSPILKSITNKINSLDETILIDNIKSLIK